MEDLFVYKVDPSEVKPGAVIDGIDKIQDVTLAWRCYDQGVKDYRDGHRDTMPEKPKEGIQEVEKRYPVAAVYLYAEEWVNSGEPIKVRMGMKAQEQLMNGADPNTVKDAMKTALVVFIMAQEG